MGLNLDLMVQGLITRVVPRSQIQIYLYAGQVNVQGTVSPSYTGPFASTAQVQIQSPQTLTQIQGISITENYVRFYIQSNTLTGLNRNIGTGGDYIVMNNLKYTIIQVVEQFNVGWVMVVGIEEPNL